MLVLVIDRWSRQYPRVKLHVSYADTTTLEYPQLHERSVDLVLARMVRAPSHKVLITSSNGRVVTTAVATRATGNSMGVLFMALLRPAG
jgi:hypothetical protein